MSRLRIIAIEKVFISGANDAEPCIACAYYEGKLFVYDTFGELYHQMEYFNDFDSLIYLITTNKYEWTDFYINKGDIITRDGVGNAMLNGKRINGLILPLKEENNKISDVSVKLYYEILSKFNKNNPSVLEQLTSSFESGEFKKDILAIVKEYPLEELTTDDNELIVRSRIEGYNYISKKIKSFVSSKDPYKNDAITYFFTRLFKLQYQNYIQF
jgi:hypothetical protein